MLGIGLGITQLSLRAPFSPLTLFAASEQGVWLDPSDLSTLFQDDAGTTPVTAAGQSVALVLDKSRGGTLQPNSAPGGGTFDNATGWTLSGSATVTGGQLIFLNGAIGSAWYNTTLSAGTFVRYSIDKTVLGASGAANVQLRFRSGVSTILAFSLGGANGPITTSGLVQIPSACDNIEIGYNGTGSYQYKFDNISVRELPGNHATQSVFASRPTYRVTSGIPNIEDDLVDDAINWTALAGNYTVAWVDTAGTVTIQTAQALTGATDALKAQNMVGYVAIGRALTAAETASLTAWFKAKAGV